MTVAPLDSLAAKSPPRNGSTGSDLLPRRKCACGNPASSLTGSHTKLVIGASNDVLEQEAEHVSDQVLAKPAPLSVSDAAPPRIQRVAEGSPGGSEVVPGSVDRVLATQGVALEPTLRQDMEQRFGHDFSAVRVHCDGAAERSARDVSALAYAVGHHIVFGAGQFAPESSAGRRLVAHELTHVVQQRGAARASEAAHGGALAVTASPQAGLSLQRYKVPGNLKCTEVAAWLDANSPYAPEWAQTSCGYSFDGQLKVSPPRKSGAGVSLTASGHAGLTVGVKCPTDLPDWSPSGREGRTKQFLAWMKMIKVLDAHEARHRKIGQDWRKTLEQRFKATATTVTGTDEADARTKLADKLAADQQKWQQQAQSAQSKIDPFRGAVLSCPEDLGMEEIRPQPDKIAEGLLPPAPVTLDEPKPAGKPKELSPELKKLFP